ncbi:MAG: hypothetical protein IPN29_17455 [Saprospiraceae bacterium]|nr:hypothetical protein [Saprospiraceae bacterium]
MRLFFLFALSAGLFSCTQNNDVFPTADIQSHIRSRSPIEVEIHTTADEWVRMEVNELSLSNPGTESFTVEITDGNQDQQTYYAVSLYASQAEDSLRIIKNPGLNQTVYEEKGEINVIPNTSSSFQLTINPGNIQTGASTCIIEELGGV